MGWKGDRWGAGERLWNKEIFSFPTKIQVRSEEHLWKVEETEE